MYTELCHVQTKEHISLLYYYNANFGLQNNAPLNKLFQCVPFGGKVTFFIGVVMAMPH